MAIKEQIISIMAGAEDHKVVVALFALGALTAYSSYKFLYLEDKEIYKGGKKTENIDVGTENIDVGTEIKVWNAPSERYCNRLWWKGLGQLCYTTLCASHLISKINFEKEMPAVVNIVPLMQPSIILLGSLFLSQYVINPLVNEVATKFSDKNAYEKDDRSELPKASVSYFANDEVKFNLSHAFWVVAPGFLTLMGGLAHEAIVVR